jgi:quercetin dioxygenase-like cupin family protein
LQQQPGKGKPTLNKHAKTMKEKIVKAAEGQRINVLGDNQVIKLTGKESNGQLAVIIQNLPPGVAVPKHVHTNDDEHFHLLEGEVHFEVGTDEYTLKAGDMIFLPRHIPHSLRVVGDKAAVVRLSIIPAGAEEMFMELDKLPDGPPDFAKVAGICGRYGVSFV